MIQLTPQELVSEIRANGLNLAQIAKRTGIPLTVVFGVNSGERRWIRYTFVDALRALLAELRSFSEADEKAFQVAAEEMLNGHPTDIAH